MPVAQGVIGGGLARIGYGVTTSLRTFGGIAALSWDTFVAFVRGPREWTQLFHQIRALGVNSMSIAFLTAAATGMIFAVQFGFGLRRFGASQYAGKLVALAFVMELGPVLTSLVVGARVGAGITAETGSMRVTEQIDAIRALGASPINKLVLPRVLACTLAMPVLVMMADLIGITAAMFISMAQVGTSARFYWDQVLTTLDMGNIAHGLIKSVAFGFIIGIVGCYYGLRTTGGTEGVGRSTTESVVVISISILLSDFLLGRLLLGIL